MLKRFKTGMFQPTKIINYRQDPKWMTAIYFLILILLVIIPSMISLISSSGLDYEDKLFLKTEISKVDIPYELSNYELFYKNTTEEEKPFVIELSETFSLVFTEQDSNEFKYNPISQNTYIFFTKDKILYYGSIFEIVKEDYTNYSALQNLDFGDAKMSNHAFWTKVFNIANDLLDQHSVRTKIINLVSAISANVIFNVMLSLIITLFYRSRLVTFLSFSKNWQMVIYLMTPFTIFTLLGELFGFGILGVVGLVMSYVYVNKMSKAIITK